MKKGSNPFLWWGIGVIIFIILVSIGAIILVAPAILGTLGIIASNEVYHATGGVIGKPAPPPPPVEVKVGEQLLNESNGIVITWNGTQFMGTRAEIYWGDDQGFVTVYALNVTNNENVPIVKVAINYYYGGATNYPPIKPWYTNSSFNEPNWGPETNWAFANVTIAPHTSVILYNATGLSVDDIIIFYFANGSTYSTRPTYIPSVPI